MKSFVSRLCFAWVTEFIKANAKRPLEREGLLPLPAGQDTASDLAHFCESLEHDPTKNLIRAIWRVHRRALLVIVLLAALLMSASISNPLILRRLIKSLASLHTSTTTGASPGECLLYAGLLVLSSLTAIIAVHNMFNLTNLVAMRVRAVLSALVYRKALTLSPSARLRFTSGFILNLLSIDAPKIMQSLIMVHSLFFHPLQIVIVVSLLYALLGPPALVATAVTICILLLSLALGKYQVWARTLLSKAADRRITVLHEFFAHIKAVKFQGAEDLLTARVDGIRKEETRYARKMLIASAGTLFLSSIGAALSLFSALAVAIYRGDILNAETIFPALALLVLLRFALGVLPETILGAAESVTALKRLQNFLCANDHVPMSIESDSQSAISVTDATFVWPDGKEALSLKGLSIARGELVAIVGSVGAGKSALLKAVSGEIERLRGSVTISGRLGFIPQHPWIVSDTVRANILCGASYEAERYARCLEASGLTPDLALLPAADATGIGERGVNLSGGQRQRVAIARALYAQPEVILLDDPLSALDPRVAEDVFQHAILGELHATTRIFVTHRLEFALRADRVLVMEDGDIVEDGPPELLKTNQARFNELFAYHAQSQTADQPATERPEPFEFQPATDEVEEREFSATTAGTIVLEDRARGALRGATILRYLKLLTPYTPLLGVLLFAFLMLARQAFVVSTDLWVARFSDGQITNIEVFIGGYLALVLSLCTVTALRAGYVLISGLYAGVRTHQELLRGVLAAPLRFFESNPIGRVVNRFSSDVATVETALPRNLLETAHHLLEVISVALFTIIAFPPTLVAIAPVVWVYIRCISLYRPTGREGQRVESMCRSPLFALLGESIAGAATIRISGLRERFSDRFIGYLDDYTRAYFSLNAANRWVGVRLEVIGTAIIPIIALSAIFFPSSYVTPGVAALILTYSLSLMASMNWFGRMLVLSESSLTSYERIETYAHTKGERWRGSLAPPPTWPSKGALTFKSVNVRYRPELPLALRSLSVEIPARCRVGIVGRTGSGKSTLVMALLRMIELESGEIELDGIPLSSIDLALLRKVITVVPQEPFLISGPLRNAVDPFNRFSDDEVLGVMRRVDVHDVVERSPAGLSTELREGGGNLSSGERQLLCLARALLYGAKVVVLDEATAHIDLETDHKLQKVLRREFSKTTLLVIAHRIETIIDSDLIIALHNGELVEADAPERLLSRTNSLFSLLVAR